SRVGALNGAAHLDGAGPAATHSSALIEPALLREVAARSFVLLKNPRGLLPLHAGSVERVALIGPNAIEPQTQGGGSVRVLAAQGMAIADAVRDGLDAYVSVHQGAITSATVALPHAGTLHDPVSGKAGVRREVEVRVDYRPDGRFAALRLGIEPQADEDSLLEQAVKAAAGADVAIVVVGSADGTESEGYDRQTLVLPGRQDELIRRVAAAN